MFNSNDTSAIPCKIHQDSFSILSVIKQKINDGTSIGVKAKYAEELTDRVMGLIDCLQYDNQKRDCRYCHLIAKLHIKTAELIIKAKFLST